MDLGNWSVQATWNQARDRWAENSAVMSIHNIRGGWGEAYLEEGQNRAPLEYEAQDSRPKRNMVWC